ncbi:MAG TPA: CHAT domain-containing protein, partial [Candidatus Udaeobacter sp.]|nr:CHAT domain-containing protein [Candidatus Udaeobacter sp.]
TAWRAELSRSLPADPATRRAAERRCNAAGERLRRAIWDPARGALIGARRVIVIPDGVLALIPLQALPIGADRYLVDSSPLLVQLAAERDLVRPADVPSGRGLLAMGGMNYDAGTKSPALLAAAETADRGLPPCREFGDVRFTPLAGTGEEAQDVSRLFARSSLGGEPVELLAGAEATEAACRARAPGRRVIHLATHGFYVDPACALPAGVATRGTAGLMPATDLPASAPVDPLRLCGIAFAGANQRAAATDGANDGVLTAGEVASLDLEGTKIVTLSACESGLGIPVSGEGVLGLERAFHIAGADVVVMSLWPVNDRAAREWMGDFYRTLWLEHRDPAEAARAASRAALQRLRAAGRPTHPGEWAMFVPSGLMR